MSEESDGGLTSDLKVRMATCNMGRGTSVWREGAKAYLINTTGSGPDGSYEMLVRSRSGRWVRHWERVKYLTNWRHTTVVMTSSEGRAMRNIWGRSIFEDGYIQMLPKEIR